MAVGCLCGIEFAHETFELAASLGMFVCGVSAESGVLEYGEG